MKNGIKLMIVMMVLLTAFSCRDRNVEKKIAELESRVAQLEGNKPVSQTPAAVPAANNPVAQNTPEEKPEGPLPEIQFDNMDYDFGTVPEGPKVSHIYKVKNTGKAPLTILEVKPTCGCTTPDWTKTPIPIGGTGIVKAEFDTKGRPGVNNKTITVLANTWPKATTLKFKAMVTPKPTGENGPANN